MVQTISYSAERVVGTGSFGIVFQVITKPESAFSCFFWGGGQGCGCRGGVMWQSWSVDEWRYAGPRSAVWELGRVRGRRWWKGGSN